MSELFPLFRAGPHVQALRFRFEKAGLLLGDQPIPWGADSVWVEAVLQLPSGYPARNPSDFPLTVEPGRPPHSPQTVSPLERGGVRLIYRLPVPAHTATAELLHRQRSLAQLVLPVLTPEEFGRRLKLETPTLAVCLGEGTVACRALVGAQCQGLIAAGMLKSSHYSLVSLLDLGLTVALAGSRGENRTTPVRLAVSQLTGRDALVTALLPKPRRLGDWHVVWTMGEKELARLPLRSLSKPGFLGSLRLYAARFVVVDRSGHMTLESGIPVRRAETARIGPCFVVGSQEPGMAGLARLRVVARVPGAVQPPLLDERDMLISDGPQTLLPGTLSIDDLAQVESFDLYSPRGLLGRLPLKTPTATFDGEGGFAAPSDFTWSEAAEDELKRKLAALTATS